MRRQRRHNHGFTLTTAIAIACLCLVALEGNLPRTGTPGRTETPGLMMLAALPQRRLVEQHRERAVYAAEAVCPDAVRDAAAGFTLIELSIVLVIIGLIVGGVLVGQDLIKAAETRAQIAQIEKYNSAVNAFKTKYNGLPGDLIYTDAANFGFVTSGCNGVQGFRDGNGLIDGWPSLPLVQGGGGETGYFWSDLSTAGFIDAQIPGSGSSMPGCSNLVNLTSTTIAQFLPPAKLGKGNYIYVYETNGQNWFGLSTVTSINEAGNFLLSNATIPVTQAYNIDKKIDDGQPTTGEVVAVYINNSQTVTTAAPSGNPDTASTCYNNSTNTYSTNVNNGSGPNCALSFKMQGAAR